MGDACSCDLDPSEAAAIGLLAGAGAVGGAAALYWALGGKRPSLRLNNPRLRQHCPPPHPLPQLPPLRQPAASASTGRHALLIGCNYFGTPYQLDGCINDVKRTAQLLNARGYYIIALTDDSRDARYLPTKAGIINGLRHLLSRAAPGGGLGQRLWIHFSGHGSQVKDTTGQEADGLDETICPVDFKKPQDGYTHGMITDDDLNEIFVAQVPRGHRVIAVMDCCHSGTVLDLPYYAVASRPLSRPSTARMVADQFTGTHQRIASDVVLISGCQDWEKSADIKDVGEAFVQMKAAERRGAGGVLTTALLVALERRPQHSLASLLDDIRSSVQRLGFDQVPQMSGSRPYDMRCDFNP